MGFQNIKSLFRQLGKNYENISLVHKSLKNFLELAHYLQYVRLTYKQKSFINITFCNIICLVKNIIFNQGKHKFLETSQKKMARGVLTYDEMS